MPPGLRITICRMPQGLELHHFYRATVWLGEDVKEKGADAMTPRCVQAECDSVSNR
jgi:hypothetical protein